MQEKVALFAKFKDEERSTFLALDAAWQASGIAMGSVIYNVDKEYTDELKIVNKAYNEVPAQLYSLPQGLPIAMFARISSEMLNAFTELAGFQPPAFSVYA